MTEWGDERYPPPPVLQQMFLWANTGRVERIFQVATRHQIHWPPEFDRVDVKVEDLKRESNK